MSLSHNRPKGRGPSLIGQLCHPQHEADIGRSKWQLPFSFFSSQAKEGRTKWAYAAFCGGGRGDPEVAHITSAHRLISHTYLQGKLRNHCSWQPCTELELRSPDIEGQNS